MPVQRILVVDDEEAVCDTIEDGLHLAGYATFRASDGIGALDTIRKERPDLVILDINMPRMDGFEVLRKMRANSLATPVILLTARHDRTDTVTGLKLGADDYVRKPFGLEELLLRVAAVLRRASGAHSIEMRAGQILVDVAQHSVTATSRAVDLSPTEFRLLEYLLENKNHVMSKQQILDAVWGIDFDSNTTVVETFISYLRRKLSPEIDDLLVTVRGIGFKIVDKP